MVGILKIIIKLIEPITEHVGKAATWLTAILVVLVGFHVATRHFFNYNPAWMMELEWHLFALIFLFGAGYALKHDRHVRVDLFYSRFSIKDKALTNFIGTLIFLIPWCCFIILYATDYALASFQLDEGSPDPGGLPARYIIKFCVVCGMIILLLQGIATLAKTSLELFFKNSEWK